MKKIIVIMLAAVAFVWTAGEARAQMGKREYVNAGWQYNGSIANNFVEAGNGYGAYLKGGYYVTPMFAVGGFASFNTNNDYIPKQTYTFKDQSALTTDVDRSIYQVPFGLTMRTRFMRGELQPYLGTKIGAEFSTQSTYMSTFVNRHDNWGFYMSPEVGFNWFPFQGTDFGFHLAAYYSFATNRNKAYGMDGINNLGFKLGIAF
jgi:hypothetical protein